MRNPFRKRVTAPEAGGPAPRLVVGLGNPGGEHVGTRHNVGFEVVDLLAARVGVRLRRSRFHGAAAETRIAGMRVILLEPHTYMNLSGRAVRAAADYYRVGPQGLLVVCDDVHLPVGRIRLRRSGGPGGHNGLTSIIQALGSQDFARLRVGVNEPPPYMSQVDHVLSRFEAEEREAFGQAIARAAEAVESWVGAGVEEAMNKFN